MKKKTKIVRVVLSIEDTTQVFIRVPESWTDGDVAGYLDESTAEYLADSVIHTFKSGPPKIDSFCCDRRDRRGLKNYVNGREVLDVESGEWA